MTALPARTGKRAVARVVEAALVVVFSLAYLSSVFQIFQRTFWTSGIGDWMDPYFINALLEHWFQSAARLTDPSSPPMYFPAEKTLGYSHGLVLYALAYLPFRLVAHPFQAYSLTLFAVMETGIVCLYLLLRRCFRLAFVEAALLSAFFVSSLNVVNGGVGIWSQRASVFLIPPVLLMLVVSRQMPDGGSKLVVAGLAGLFASLMFTQDFYTALFAVLFWALYLAAAMLLEARRPLRERIAARWTALGGYGPKTALVTTVLAAAWTAFVTMSGGGAVTILGVRIVSRDWRRPAVIALAGLVAFVGLRRGIRRKTLVSTASPWLASVTLGAAGGILMFLWIYLAAYRDHPSFPEDNLLNALALRDPALWRSPLDFLKDLNAYRTLRPFTLVFVAGILAWVPWLHVDRKERLYSLWLVLVSLVVLVIPLRFGGFSVWRVFFERLPGFAAVRDPQRIIALYELAVVLGIALVMARVPGKSVYRISVAVLVLLLLGVGRNREVFDYLRPNDVYDRWVGAPIEIDRSCSSFFIKRASADYSSRLDEKWWLYNIDSVFVALNSSIPTMNGYSAWFPGGWDLFNPEEEDYGDRVRHWIERHALTGVCELDIDARTMKPYGPAR